MKFLVENALSARTNDFGPRASLHDMHEDLVGTLVTLERGSRPIMLVLDVADSMDGIRCFARVMGGPTKGTTFAPLLADLGPFVPLNELLPHDRRSR